jgi:predicted dehydrogenase
MGALRGFRRFNRAKLRSSVQTRRHFIGNVATGLAGSIATGRALGANNRIRVGVIGVGERGMQLAREAAACPNTELVAAADVYSRRLDEAKSLAARDNEAAFTGYSDYRALLEDKSIDAVLIATPQHLHAEHFIAVIDAGKHVYQEKAMAFTVEHAKLMRAARERSSRTVVQVGHQSCSSGQIADASGYLASGVVGHVTAIHARMYRNSPAGKPQWTRPVYPDMTPDNVAWEAFLGNAPARDFDPDRLINWRLFWDYSGGNVHENMSHQLAFWNRVMGLNIPAAATMTGGIYLWKDGREVPDTMTVSLELPGEMLFTWDSGFGNNYLGVTEDVLGTHGTIARGQQIRYVPQRVNRPGGSELMGHTPTVPRAHMQNFLDVIRNGGETACPFELGYRVSVACHMAVESYLQQRTVRWDAVNEEIV